MTQNVIAGRENAIRTLRRLAGRRPQTEHCEFCSSNLSPSHRHLLEIETRRVVCVCDPCALRFENVIGRWKLIPRDPITLSDFNLTEAEWEGFALPINLAFFFQSTPAKKVVAMYPSPAGATESLLSLGAWDALVVANPILKRMQSDVEALLVKRLGASPEYYIAPIDMCFELVGIIRLHWRGFSGGPDVWKEIGGFFDKLKSMTRHPTAMSNAEEACHA
jgi:hypothetical protein